MFYLAQIAAALYLTVQKSSKQIDDIFDTLEGFNMFYNEHYALLHPFVWREYYSEPFLKQKTTARFYRLPDLRDLPNSNNPLDIPIREQPHSSSPHDTKLPRWAYNVACTYLRQHLLPLSTLTNTALNTLETTINRQRKEHPNVQPYSETQARFWLEYMVAPYLEVHTNTEAPSPTRWNENCFGILAAQGFYDMYEWERKYSVQLWESSWKHKGVLEPDIEDGARESEIIFCGHPDGGISSYAWWRGWDGELGSEEEIEFLTAIAAEETEGIEQMDQLDFTVRSHILLGVMWAAVKIGQEDREDLLQKLETGMLQSGRIEKERAGLWLREALEVIKPYVWEGLWPDVKERQKTLRQILVENGQLFARWKVSPHLKEFSFALDPPVYQG